MKFIEFVSYLKKLEETSSRIELSEILYELLKNLSPDEAKSAVYLILGEILPSFYGLEFGISEKLIIEALSKSAKVKVSEVTSIYKKTGDLGETAKELIKREGKNLDLLGVYKELLDIARSRGTLDKLMKFISLINALSPDEAKYVVRIVDGKLRLGVGDATIIEALALVAGSRSYKTSIEKAYNLCSDIGLVAEKLLLEGIDSIKNFSIRVGYPVRMALAERVSSPEEIIKRLGECAIEGKYDGMRIQVHKNGSQVHIYSRNLENVTHMFPEVVDECLKTLKVESIIFEGEAITYNEDTGEFYPFQITIQRKRKYDIHRYVQEYPLKVFTFDILYINGEDMTQKPFIERRKILEKVLTNRLIIPSEMNIVKDAKDIQKIFEKAISQGLEGVMAKRLDAPYLAGSRNYNWIKLKRSYKGSLADTIDVVIVGYFYGKGLRAKLGIGSLLVAVYNPNNDTFETISKVGSGFSEHEWIHLKNILDGAKLTHKHARVNSLIEPDVWVEPKYVITVTADEITRSPLHTAGRDVEDTGYALRFPRALGLIRSDKNAEDATTVDEIIKLYQIQQKRAIE